MKVKDTHLPNTIEKEQCIKDYVRAIKMCKMRGVLCVLVSLIFNTLSFFYLCPFIIQVNIIMHIDLSQDRVELENIFHAGICVMCFYKSQVHHASWTWIHLYLGLDETMVELTTNLLHFALLFHQTFDFVCHSWYFIKSNLPITKSTIL